MLLIYSRSTTARLKYTFDFVFKEVLGISYTITHDASAFLDHEDAKINFSDQHFGSEIFIYSTDLLFEKGIHSPEITVHEWNECKMFFKTDERLEIPFDLFAAVFYMISRYEEYLPFRCDALRRFPAKESLASQHGFLQQPIVNIWIMKLKDIIHRKYPSYNFPAKHFQYISTIDIDNAFAYKHKGIIRTTGSMLRSASKFKFKQISDRLLVLLGRKHDPYDTYEDLLRIKNQYSIKTIYFFLLGDYAENDKNVSISRNKFRTLIKTLSDYSDCGIHPSYASNSEPHKIGVEIKRLRRVLQREVTKSRQHFLKLTFPLTYRRLIDQDILHDYTMGFAQEVGFRAGTCSSFLFYDLDLEMQTNLRIHPFAVMDATLRYYMKVKPEDAMKHIQPLIDQVKAVNGTFISLWHNESVSDVNPWHGWKFLYEATVKAATEK